MRRDFLGVLFCGRGDAWSRLRELDNADVVINLALRSVNCRYNSRNRREILESRINSTQIIGKAIEQVSCPPRLWLNASTATIYRHSFDKPMDESTGEIDVIQPSAPSAWNFSTCGRFWIWKKWTCSATGFPLGQWTALDQISPASKKFLVTMVLLALPFIWIGVTRPASVSVARDCRCGWSCFFVPFLNAPFLSLLCLAPETLAVCNPLAIGRQSTFDQVEETHDA